MADFLVWASVVWGVTMIVTTTKIFLPLRNALPHAGPGEPVGLRTFVGTLLRCPLCLAFWVGAFFAALGYTPVVVAPGWLPSPVAYGITLIAAGAASSAVSWTWHVVLVRLGSLDL